jgi:hypothetical protein
MIVIILVPIWVDPRVRRKTTISRRPPGKTQAAFVVLGRRRANIIDSWMLGIGEPRHQNRPPQAWRFNSSRPHQRAANARLERLIRICSSKVEQPALNRQARVRSPPDPRICVIRRALFSDNSISIRKTHDCRGMTNPCVFQRSSTSAERPSVKR